MTEVEVFTNTKQDQLIAKKELTPEIRNRLKKQEKEFKSAVCKVEIKTSAKASKNIWKLTLCDSEERNIELLFDK